MIAMKKRSTHPTQLLSLSILMICSLVSTGQAQTHIGHRTFNEGTGTAAADSISPAANLSLGGTSTWSTNTPFLAATGQTGGFSFSTNGGAPENFADAFFDDIRIYSGTLHLSQLEGIRMAAIPEPTTAALMLGASAFAILICRRSRARLNP